MVSKSNSNQMPALEVMAFAYKLLLSLIPLLPIRWKHSLYFSYVNNLSETAFNGFGRKIVVAYPCTKRGSKRFKNTEKELEDILRLCSRLNTYRGILREFIGQKRRGFGLK